MRSLLIVSHGSRRQASNEEIRDLAALVAERAGTRYGHVGHAFLEIAKPTISEGIEAALQAGASEVVVFPYFLSAGRHVAEDIPAEVMKKQAECPQASIRIAPYLGQARALTEIVLGLSDAPPSIEV